MNETKNTEAIKTLIRTAKGGKTLTAISEEVEAAQRAKKERQARIKAQAEADGPLSGLPSNAQLTFEDVRGYAERVRDNDTLADYYEQLELEENGGRVLPETQTTKAVRIRGCARSWFFDFYKRQNVKDLKSVYLCHDKFCLNCQALQQAVRLTRFSPVLEELSEQGKHVYHAVFTCPNVKGDQLSATIKKMKASIRMIIRYLQGTTKTSLRLDRFGFLGGVRSLEVTTENGYHAHFHCAFTFDKPLYDGKTRINKFSYDYRQKPAKLVRRFSEIEIIFQKLFYLLMNDIPTTKAAVEDLKDGYSVTVDECDGTVYEVFKYVVKFEKNTDGRIKMTFNQFKTLHNALKGVHVFQGYGVFRHVAEPVRPDEELAQYEYIVQRLKLVETPILECERIDELTANVITGKHFYITRRTVDAFIKDNPEFMASLSENAK